MRRPVTAAQPSEPLCLRAGEPGNGQVQGGPLAFDSPGGDGGQLARGGSNDANVSTLQFTHCLSSLLPASITCSEACLRGQWL